MSLATGTRWERTMAEWIKWVKGLTERREVVWMASHLQIDRRIVAAALMELWEWADENVKPATTEPYDGTIDVGPKPLGFIDSLLDVAGMAEMLASQSIGWLRIESDGRLTFPRLGRHNGETAKKRAEDARRKAEERRNKPTELAPQAVDDDWAPRPFALSVTSIDAGIVGIEINGELVTYDQDSLRWEATFIAMWNKTSGTTKHSGSALSQPMKKRLIARLNDPSWRWKTALAMFPLWLPDGPFKPGMTWFLDELSVQQILEEKYAKRAANGPAGNSKADPTKIRTGGDNGKYASLSGTTSAAEPLPGGKVERGIPESQGDPTKDRKAW